MKTLNTQVAYACCRRTVSASQWILPGATLALIPKCPMCLAAYVAIWTGFGISVSTASYLRIGAITVSIAAICFLVIKTFTRLTRGWRRNALVGE